jgi:hypothetical protein
MTEPRGGWVQYLSGLLHATERPPTLVELPRANQKVAVLTLLRREQRWPGSPPERFRSVPNKPTLQFNDQPTWGEFALLRLLEGDGWNGAWVKNWGGRAFWRDVEEVTVLSAPAYARFQQIQMRMGGRGGGCWDIIAARGNEVLFIESKQLGRDRLRLTQRTWMEAALQVGVPLSSFVIVEWVAPPAKA